jgi:hypothetical protein
MADRMRGALRSRNAGTSLTAADRPMLELTGMDEFFAALPLDA